MCSAGFESLRDGHSRQQQMPFAVTAFPVKMRLERSAERSKRKYKIIFPLKIRKANAARIQNRPVTKKAAAQKSTQLPFAFSPY